MTRLRQQTRDCSDLDVLLGSGDQPSFRALLPEWIRGAGVKHPGLLHIIPGAWRLGERGAAGRFTVADQLKVEVEVEAEEAAIEVRLTVTNVGDLPLSDLWANVCAAVNHLPGEPGWSNERFLPGVPLDRSVQGRYWFEVHTPRRLFAFTEAGPVPMHPCPDRPDASSVPVYSFKPSPTADGRACAVESAAGGLWFYQHWDTPCRWCTPCPGNACMHLEPFLAGQLPAGAAARIRGRIGMHRGDRASLGKWLDLLP